MNKSVDKIDDDDDDNNNDIVKNKLVYSGGYNNSLVRHNSSLPIQSFKQSSLYSEKPSSFQHPKSHLMNFIANNPPYNSDQPINTTRNKDKMMKRRFTQR
jgi:hypothetical protein